MTDKQKKAIKILNELWYVSCNDGLVKLRDEDYYLLIECVLDNQRHFKGLTEEQWEDYFKNRDRTPLAQCTLPDGICTNPFHDCVNCPRRFGGGIYTNTTDKVEVQQ